VTMKLPKSMTFQGQNGQDDRTDFFLAALNSHDGKSAYRAVAIEDENRCCIS
jgi:hypothetical protein